MLSQNVDSSNEISPYSEITNRLAVLAKFIVELMPRIGSQSYHFDSLNLDIPMDVELSRNRALLESFEAVTRIAESTVQRPQAD